MTETRLCRDCSFFASREKECRKNAPTAFPIPKQSALGEMSVSVMGCWPATREAGWCGQFEHRVALVGGDA